MSDQADVTGKSLGIAIGHLALKRGMISPEQLREALSEQSKSGFPGGTLRPLDSILLSRGFLTQEQLNFLHTLRETTTFGASVPSQDVPPPPEELGSIGKYRLVREAGRGAMARVYAAVDTELERKVALKMLISSPNAGPEENRLEEERFLREARLCANLAKHPHIVGVYDAGVSDGRRYLAMEFVEGRPMDQWMKKGSVTIGRPTTLLRDVALAVHHAHQHGVIHRDLKPANILVDENNQPHVMDFGLAKLVGKSVTMSYTEGGLAVGTPAYMSPEQASGTKAVDRRTDVYSIGVMLYEVLTGRLPFVGASPMEVMQKSTRDPVVPPSKLTSVQINPVHFRTLEAICMTALAKDPADRYPTAEALAADLSRWLRGQDFRVTSARVRRRVTWTLGSAAALLLVLSVLHWVQPWELHAQRQLARADQLLKEGKAEQALAIYNEALARDAASLRAQAGRKEALRQIRETPPAGAAADPWAGAVDVLGRLRLPEDVVSGTWSIEQGTLVSREGRPARLQIPYHPPDEYDLRISFARRTSNWCVDLILSQSGRPFTLVMQKDGVFGFEKVRGKDFSENPTCARLDRPLELGRFYSVVVEVRRTGLKSYCDGYPISQLHRLDPLTMNPQWELPDPSAIGIGTWDGGAAIRKIEIRELSGRGVPTREAKRSDPAKD